jgi:sugar phosphate permease
MPHAGAASETWRYHRKHQQRCHYGLSIDAYIGSMPRPQAGVTIVRWRILVLIITACFVGYFLRSNMSVAGEAMMRDLSLSKAQLGFILAGFAWGYAAFQFAGGVLGERLGARRIITLCLLAWGVLPFIIALRMFRWQ